MATPPAESVQYARTSDGIVVIRVTGRATHIESPSLRFIFEKTSKQTPPPNYVVDLDHCTTMDSTFMGTLASLGLHQRKAGLRPVIVVNVQSHVRYLLETLGLGILIEIRDSSHAAADGIKREAFKPAQAAEMSAIERLVMMIEAHENLVDIHDHNEIKFEGVLTNLRESLDRAKQRGAATSD